MAATLSEKERYLAGRLTICPSLNPPATGVPKFSISKFEGREAEFSKFLIKAAANVN